MIVQELNEVYTDAPDKKKIHRLGSSSYGTRCTLFDGESVENFEEVNIEDIPKDPEFPKYEQSVDAPDGGV